MRDASSANDKFDGTTLDKCRWTTILNETAAGYRRRRRQAAHQGAGRRHHRRHGEREEHRAAAGADRRQLVGDDQGVDRRHRRLHPGRSRRLHQRHQLGQVRRDATPDGDWMLELGRRINGDWSTQRRPARRRRPDDQLQMFSTGTAIRGRYSLDDGTTWTRWARASRHRAGRLPRSASPPTTAPAPGRHVRWFTVGDAGRRARHLRDAARRARLPTLFDGTAESLEDWNMAGPGLFPVRPTARSSPSAASA